MPAGHDEHVEAAPGEYRPRGHSTHDAKPDPAWLDAVPGGHALHATLPAADQKPARHATQLALLVARGWLLAVPSGHSSHVDEPTADHDPVAHGRQNDDDEAPGVLLNVPAAHAVQSPSDVALLADPKVPSGHTVQAAAPSPLNVPGLHGWHAVTVDAPSAALAVPAGHLTHDDRLVRDSSALYADDVARVAVETEPAGHGVGVEVPTAPQYEPAGQSSQLVEPGIDVNVPMSHSA